MKLLCVLVAALVVGATEAGECGNSIVSRDGWNHGLVDPKPRSSVSLQCSRTGISLTVESPAVTQKVVYQVGHYDDTRQFVANSNPACQITHCYDEQLCPSAESVEAVSQTSTKRKAEDDAFNFLSRNVPAEVINQISFEHGQCGGVINGDEVTFSQSNLVIRVTEYLPSGLPGITLPTTAFVEVFCESTVGQPELQEVSPTVTVEEVQRCRSCEFGITAQTLPVGSNGPNQTQVDVSRGSCPPDPVFSWFIQELNYTNDRIVANGVIAEPLGSDIAAKVSGLDVDGFRVETDLVVLDSLLDLDVSAKTGYKVSAAAHSDLQVVASCPGAAVA